jgi:hypothetical protein
MHKSLILFSLVLLLAGSLAACVPAGGSPEGTGTAVTDAPLATDLAGTPMGGGTTTAEGTVTGEATGTAAATVPVPEDDVVDPGVFSNLVGLAVTTNDDQSAGTVTDVIFDVATGRVSYIVLSFNATDGTNRLVAVPFEFFVWNPMDGTFMISIDLATLAGAPAFEDGEIPDTTQSGWDSASADYWAAY